MAVFSEVYAVYVIQQEFEAMAGCCSEDDHNLKALSERQSRVLWTVLLINAVMFFVEFASGWLAGSTALLGDSLDMLGDALVYGLSLFALTRGVRWKAVSATFKGSIMAIFGVVVLAEVARKIAFGAAPDPAWMAAVGALALAMNIVCFALINRHRSDDINLRSAWICSRNDLFANSGVLLAAGLVAVSGSPWPDIIIGIVIAGLFLRSAVGVLRESIGELRTMASQ